jgi:uncharacterized protein YutE (UPF0331/DUF86 family)
METDVILNKLESLVLCARRIESKRPVDLETLEHDIDVQDIIVVNLERAVQTCVDIGTHLLSDYTVSSPLTMADVFRAMAEKGLIDTVLSERLVRAVGFRNIAVHQYQSINWKIVYSIITSQMDDFRLFAGSVGKLTK